MKLFERIAGFLGYEVIHEPTKTSFERLCDAVDEVNAAMVAYRADPVLGRLTFWIEREGTGPQQITLSQWNGRPTQVHP